MGETYHLVPVVRGNLIQMKIADYFKKEAVYERLHNLFVKLKYQRKETLAYK